MLTRVLRAFLYYFSPDFVHFLIFRHALEEKQEKGGTADVNDCRRSMQGLIGTNLHGEPGYFVLKDFALL